MKLKELFDVVNDTQYFDVYYEDKSGNLVKCGGYNDRESFGEKYSEAEVVNISVTKYNTLDILVERVAVNKRYTVNFSIPSWVDLDDEITIEFEDDEDEREIEDRIADEFEDWLDRLVDNIKSEAEKEVTDIEEYSEVRKWIGARVLLVR